MSAIGHLIQPLDVFGEVLCVDQHGSRMTKAVTEADLNDLPTTKTVGVADPWTVVRDTAGSYKELIDFGVGCASSITLRVNAPDALMFVTLSYEIWRNGSLISGPDNLIADVAPIVDDDHVIALSNVACGNVIRLEAVLFHPGNSVGSMMIDISSSDDPVQPNTFSFYDAINSQYQPLI